ncbi:metal-dependent hydrolase [Halobacteriales archaeon QS_1_67_19]|nr:MAG: metal-dependent hydrolase [Halobacteriales archaeon QS_1_67_19]
MWPWEHLVVGYLSYSLFVHARYGRAPGAAPVVAVAFGTQFPDLVDKPLAWTLGLLPTGTSLAHSLFVALALSGLAVAAGRAVDRPTVGLGFAAGYLSHLPADVLYPLLVGREPAITFLLWPLVSQPPVEAGIGFGETVRVLFGKFAAAIARPDAAGYLGAELAALLVAAGVWVYDGLPPARRLWRGWRRARSTEDEP